MAGENGVTTLLKTAWTYDLLNRVATETVYQSQTAPYLTTTITHDVASEIDPATAQTHPRARVTTERNSSAGTQRTVESRNSQGQVFKIAERKVVGTDITTQFAFDSLGNTTRVAGPGGEVTWSSQDIRGRKLASQDANSGLWRYGYSGAGDPFQVIDARGFETRAAFDALARMTARVEYPGPLGTPGSRTSVWTFDSCAKGVGRLCVTVTDTGFQKVIDYDAYSRPLRATTYVNGSDFATWTLYDENGRSRYLGYPQAFRNEAPYGLKTFYNTAGYAQQVTDSQGASIWQAFSRYGDGQIYQQAVRSMTATRGYDLLGRPKTVATAGAGGYAQNATFGFDPIGNLLSRTDSIGGANESFGYDMLNRLTSVTSNVAGTKSYSYSDSGNTLTTPAGSLAYGENGAGPHAVTTGPNGKYRYDANGNQLCVLPVASSGTSCTGYTRYYEYWIHNIPARITSASGRATDFVYGSGGGRFLQLVREGPGLSTWVSQTIYAGEGMFEEVLDANGVTTWRHYLTTPEGIVGVATRSTQAPAITQRLWHKDTLGSQMAETAADGSAREGLSFDAWGKRRLASGQDGDPQLSSNTTPWGYTGQEHLDRLSSSPDGLGLIHMNGRMYDPTLGRFLSADPIITNTHSSQNWNRYSYVLNNPLSLTDPSGYSWWTQWRRPIVAIAVAYFTGYFDWGSFAGGASSYGVFGASSAFGATAANFGNAVASGFAAGGVQGGNLDSALNGAFSAALFFGVGQFVPGDLVAKVAAHAAAGCASSAAAGGSCRSGAMSAGFAELAGPPLMELAGANTLAIFAGRAIVGGYASQLGGGKFENGAVTAAFGYLFNECAHTKGCGPGSLNGDLYSGDSAANSLGLQLPFTRAGADAAFYWATLQVQEDNALYGVPGSLASLWTPDTALDTTLILGPAAAARPIAAGIGWAGTAAADWMLGSRLLGPAGPVFGNTFYAGQQGALNYGYIRVGWSYWDGKGVLQFAVRVGNRHLPLFERLPPPR